jgi:hypothetical protein
MLLSLYDMVWTDIQPQPAVTPWPQLYAVSGQGGGSLLLGLYTAIGGGKPGSVAPSEVRAIYYDVGLQLSASRCEYELEPLDIAEIDDVPFDFSGIAATETITGFQVQVMVDAGNPDVTPQLLADGLYAVGKIVDGLFYLDAGGRIVLQRFKARGRGTIYGIRGIATLTSGRKVVASATVGVTKKAAHACC